MKILYFLSIKRILKYPWYRCLLISRVQYFYTIEHAVENIASKVSIDLCNFLISGLSKSRCQNSNSALLNTRHEIKISVFTLECSTIFTETFECYWNNLSEINVFEKFMFSVGNLATLHSYSTLFILGISCQFEPFPNFPFIYRVTHKGSDFRDDWTRGGRPATTISSPSHILLIFSSEPPQNPRPSNIIFLKCLILQDKFF